MCMVCVDEVVMVATIAVAAAPWYKTIWRRVCGETQSKETK